MKTGYDRAAHLYDRFDDKDNVELFVDYASLHREVLDVGAGTGRIAVPMADAGADVTCVEPSAAMCAEFEKRLADRPVLADCVEIHEGTAQAFDLGRTFPFALMSGSFDHLLTDEDRLAALRNVNRHLESGGTLVFDVFVGLMEDRPLSPAGRVVDGDTEYRRFVETEVQDDETIAVTLVYEIYEAGERVERIVQPSKAGLIDRERVHDLLRKAGFEVAREFGDYDRTPFEAGDDLLIVEARKVAAYRETGDG